jgi:hypothetical protein
MFELVAGKVKEGMKDAGASSGDLWKVPIDEIHIIDGFNVRAENAEQREHIEFLTASIVANGFYQNRPLAGYVALKDGKNIVCLTDGHCRLEAAREAIKQGAEITALPVVISPKGTSVEDLTVGLVTNNTGKPLSQYEIGVVCKRLVDFGWDEKQIGQRLGMPTAKVSGLLELAGDPAAVRKLVSSGVVSASQAIETLKKNPETAVEKLEAGAAKAKAAGKKKATKKHIDEKPTYRAVCKALVEWDDSDRSEAGWKKVVKMAHAACGS